MDHSPQQIQLSKLRKIIADRMTASLQAAAQYTLHMEVDATNLVACKHAAVLKADGKLTYTHILIKLIAHVLDYHPQLNANFIDDVIHLYQSKNIGVAIALDDGLIVPVIKSVEEKSLNQISSSLDDLAGRAASGSLGIDDVIGGTFTISNLGAFGVDSFTPIINLPEVAILGVNRIAKKPRYVGEQLANRDITTFSLTIDHRVIDGAVAASFLKTLDQTLQDNSLMHQLLGLE